MLVVCFWAGWVESSASVARLPSWSVVPGCGAVVEDKGHLKLPLWARKGVKQRSI